MRFLLAAAVALPMLIQPTPANVPRAEISSARIRASLYLPDPASGYYRGTRFDWSGVIASLKWNGHEYFGQWFDRYDPKLHDAITGPVEEFVTGDSSSLGFAEAKPGEPFVRIGIGAVRKPDDGPYKRFDTYDLVDPGKWTIEEGPGWIEFVHELGDTNGYAYVYTKRISLSGDSMVLDHTLRNTGRKRIATSVYNHNFFTLDGATTGPDFVVRFPFAPRPRRSFDGAAEVRGSDLVFLRTFEPKQTIFSELDGFGSGARDYGFTMENRATGAGVRVTGDRPVQKLYFWSAWKTICPEPYIDVSVDAGKTSSWRTTYAFFQSTAR
jgi:hypothetical protein